MAVDCPAKHRAWYIDFNNDFCRFGKLTTLENQNFCESSLSTMPVARILSSRTHYYFNHMNATINSCVRMSDRHGRKVAVKIEPVESMESISAVACNECFCNLYPDTALGRSPSHGLSRPTLSAQARPASTAALVPSTSLV